MVTRALDVFLAQYPELMKGLEPRYPNALECCYIFPEALGQSNSINSAAKVSFLSLIIFMCNDMLAKEYHVESVWTTLERFGHSGLLDELSGTNIHRLDNVMTLTVSVCRLFDSMSLWFEEVRGKVSFLSCPSASLGLEPLSGKLLRGKTCTRRLQPCESRHTRRSTLCRLRAAAAAEHGLSSHPRDMLSCCAHVWCCGLF